MSTTAQPANHGTKRKANLLDYHFTRSSVSSVSSTNQAPTKRQHIDSINQNGTSRLSSSSSSSSTTTTTTTATKIPGLHILPEFVTPTEEDDLVTFLDEQTSWRTDLARSVIHYGGTYCVLAGRHASVEEKKAIESIIYAAEPIPLAVGFVVDRMVERGMYTAAQRLQFCIVNSYTLNQGISAHVENFRFGSPVCGLSLVGGDWMRFHELVVPDDGSVRSGKAAMAKRTGRRVDVWLPRRSLLVLAGDAREKWQHEIVRGTKDRAGPAWRRVSLTFRTLRVKN